MMRAICFLSAMCLASVMGGETGVGLITGVQLELLLPDCGAAMAVNETRQLGDIPTRVMYKTTFNNSNSRLGVAVHPDIRKAEVAFEKEVSGVSIGGVPVDGLGDQAISWGKRLSFRRANVCICTWGDSAGSCQEFARALDKALQQKSPKGAIVLLPETRVSVRKGTGHGVDLIADIEVAEDNPSLLVDKYTMAKQPVTTYSVIVVDAHKPIILATRTNVVFEVAVPPLRNDKDGR